MKRIAVFCALPPDRNTGMATVDLAAVCVLRRLAPEAEITLYAYGSGSVYPEGVLPYGYVDVREYEERYFSSDIFLFWGDFTHTRAYWLKDRQMTAQQYEDYAQYIFLKTRTASRLQHAVVYGSTIITNDALDQEDAAYYADFNRFFGNAGAVYFRDALSAAKVSPLRGNEASLGCDCAFLLEDHDLHQVEGYVPAEQRQGVGVFFSRSPSKVKMMLFAREVARYLEEPYAWLPWLQYPYGYRRERWPLAAIGFRIRAGDTDTGQILSQLSGYSYIVTDTYHVCVNAWRMGIPAICIGQGVGGALQSLSDKKKEILYEMVGARAFYVFWETLKWRRLRAVARAAAETLTDVQYVAQVQANVAQHRAMGLRRLSEALQRLLA